MKPLRVLPMELPLMRAQTDAENLYAAQLFARVGEAAILPWANVEIGDWKPQHNECHANVTEVCAHSPEYTPVRGWLYLDYGGHFDRVQFIAHSAIRDPDGVVYDITPTEASQQYPFLRALETEEEYAALIEGGSTPLWHFK